VTFLVENLRSIKKQSVTKVMENREQTDKLSPVIDGLKLVPDSQPILAMTEIPVINAKLIQNLSKSGFCDTLELTVFSLSRNTSDEIVQLVESD